MEGQQERWMAQKKLRNQSLRLCPCCGDVYTAHTFAKSHRALPISACILMSTSLSVWICIDETVILFPCRPCVQLSTAPTKTHWSLPHGAPSKHWWSCLSGQVLPKKRAHVAHVCPSVERISCRWRSNTTLDFASSWITWKQVKQSCSVKKPLAQTHRHIRFLLSLSDLIRVTGALPIGCESGPLLPRAANFPYSRADRKLWLSTELRRDKEIFPLAIHISLHHIFSYNIPPHLLCLLLSSATSLSSLLHFHEPKLTLCCCVESIKLALTALMGRKFHFMWWHLYPVTQSCLMCMIYSLGLPLFANSKLTPVL